MDKNEFINAFGLLSALEDKIHEILKAIGCKFDSCFISNVDNNGIDVRYEYYHCSSCGVDYQDVTLTWEELVMELEDLKAHRADLERAQEMQEAEEKAKKEAAAKAAKEAEEKAEYERLKEKFEK